MAQEATLRWISKGSKLTRGSNATLFSKGTGNLIFWILWGRVEHRGGGGAGGGWELRD